MLTLETTSNFRRDYKRIKRRGYYLTLLQGVIDTLLNEQVLAPKFRDHSLSGDYIGFRECHIEPDWLFVYKIDNQKLVLVASRTGTHSDLF